jgi:MFS family permease
LAAVAFAVAVGYGIVSPVLPVYARSFGVSSAAAAAVVSVFAAVRLICAPLAGRLVDRFGERLVLATGIGIVAVSSVLAGFAASYDQLILLRGAGGLGSAMFSVSSTTLLLRTVPATVRARAAGIYSGGFLIGGITGPALGGVVSGISFRLPFFIYGGTLVVAGTLGVRMLRSAATRVSPQSEMTSSVGPVGAASAAQSIRAGLRNRAYRAALAANLADNWASVGVRGALVPLFVTEAMHRSTFVTGAGFVVVAALNGLVLLPAGRVADTVGRRPVLASGLALSASALAVLSTGNGIVGYFVAMAILGLGSGMLDVAPAAVVGDVAGQRGGPLVAGYQMSGDLGTVSGPLVAGWLADAFSFDTAFLASSGIVALAAFVALLSPETHKRGYGHSSDGETVLERLDTVRPGDGQP